MNQVPLMKRKKRKLGRARKKHKGHKTVPEEQETVSRTWNTVTTQLQILKVIKWALPPTDIQLFSPEKDLALQFTPMTDNTMAMISYHFKIMNLKPEEAPARLILG
ncbi:conserved hypothetical protein [Ricinus communis]|uniref:Uncharacterized protein n=1 Tax=Ricinus communis TaxID=3988 RepID=B9SZ11_RICCO|nr:conserved hypothetical protein [Ricinus communis]